MSVLTMTAESLGSQIGAIVPELFVTIAKNSITGMDATQIAELLGVTPEEVQEVCNDSVYRDVRLLLAAEYARNQTQTDFDWNDVEQTSVQRLQARVSKENDIDTLLRIAAVANKAIRRTAVNQNKVLDPAQGAARVPLTLTRRITERLAANGEKTRTIEESRQISVLDGSAENPKFEDIDALLGVSRKPQIASNMTIRTHEPDFTIDDIEFKSR